MNQIQQNNGLNTQLNNNEILENKRLLTENQRLNNIIQNQKNEINNLKSQLQNYINLNQNLNKTINQMNINMQSNLINNQEVNNLKNEIINLKNQIKLKDNEINNLRITNNVKDVCNINDIIVINFISTKYSIHEGIKCMADETFAEVEERFYKKYDELRNTNNIFLFGGNQILRFKKLKENKIRDGAQIQLVKYVSSMSINI